MTASNKQLIHYQESKQARKILETADGITNCKLKIEQAAILAQELCENYFSALQPQGASQEDIYMNYICEYDRHRIKADIVLDALCDALEMLNNLDETVESMRINVNGENTIANYYRA